MNDLLNFVGDIYLPKKYKIDFDIDNVICNFEFPLSTKGEPAVNKINLGVDECYLLDTFKSKPLAVNLANNHIMDYGEEGYMETVKYLDKAGIKYFGAGNAGNNFNNPCKLTVSEKKIYLFGYSCSTTSPVFGDEDSNGSARLDVDKIAMDISKYRDEADHIVVQLHWGYEEVPFPAYSDTEIARQLIDNGVDLIIGHHAHVIQSKDVYKNKNIYYGLGNFIFPDLNEPQNYNGREFERRFVKRQMKKNNESLVVEFDVLKKSVQEYVTVFNGEEVKKVSGWRLPKVIPKNDEDFYSRLKTHRRLFMIKKFFFNPKVPNMSHFKRFVRMG